MYAENFLKSIQNLFYVIVSCFIINWIEHVLYIFVGFFFSVYILYVFHWKYTLLACLIISISFLKAFTLKILEVFLKN